MSSEETMSIQPNEQVSRDYVNVLTAKQMLLGSLPIITTTLVHRTISPEVREEELHELRQVVVEAATNFSHAARSVVQCIDDVLNREPAPEATEVQYTKE